MCGQDQTTTLAAIQEALEKPGHRRILLCGHVRPDGDCMGSLLAMYEYLERLGKECRLFFQPPLVDYLKSLLPVGVEEPDGFPEDWPADITLCLDSAESERIVPGFDQKARGLIINMDHHVSNNRYGDLNYVDEDAAATGELLVEYLERAAPEWTPRMASHLYLAISTDTGSFCYANTTAHTLETAARLVKRGAVPAVLAGLAYGNLKPETLRIKTEVMTHLKYERSGRLVWSEISQALYKANGGEENDPENLCGEMRAIQGVKVAALIRETPEGTARASLRSHSPYNVSEIAAKLGGGGHRAAAGLERSEPYDQAKTLILQTLREEMKKQESKIDEKG